MSTALWTLIGVLVAGGGAIAWLVAHPEVSSVIAGVTKPS